MTLPTIDHRAFEALQANAGADFVPILIEALADEAPRLIAALHRAAERGDAAAFEDAAHTLKSNAVTFGAQRLAEMARQMELRGVAASAESAIQALSAELDAVLRALRSLE